MIRNYSIDKRNSRIFKATFYGFIALKFHTAIKKFHRQLASIATKMLKNSIPFHYIFPFKIACLKKSPHTIFFRAFLLISAYFACIQTFFPFIFIWKRKPHYRSTGKLRILMLQFVEIRRRFFGCNFLRISWRKFMVEKRTPTDTKFWKSFRKTPTQRQKV